VSDPRERIYHRVSAVSSIVVSLGDNGTLAQLYGQITANPASQAWPAFRAAIDALPGGVTSDDPFNGMAHALHLSPLTLNDRTVALAGKVFAMILEDIAARLDGRLVDLPDGIQLEPGSLHVEFGKAEDLLAKLFELSKAAANDFEAFRGAAERR